jgi:hypothetical protein
MKPSNVNAKPWQGSSEFWAIVGRDGLYSQDGEFLGKPKRSGPWYLLTLDKVRYKGRGKGMIRMVPMGIKPLAHVTHVRWGSCPPEVKKRLQSPCRKFYEGFLGTPLKPLGKTREFLGEWYVEFSLDGKMIHRIKAQ